MPGLGYVSLNQLNVQGPMFTFDEGVCGMLFDCGKFESPFENYLLLEQNFNGSQTQLIHNLSEAENMGLSKDFMNGIPYYHIQSFYSYIGHDADLYLMFADCSSGFDVIQSMQQHANGKIFQLGVWTEQSIWCVSDSGEYIFTGLLGELEAQAEQLSGVVERTYTDNLPLSIIVNANTAFIEGSGSFVVDHNQVPEALSLDFPKVSVVLGQNGTDEVHAMQNTNHQYTPVGFLGLALACLAIAPAETSLGSVEQFNLNKDDSVLQPELGFGDILGGRYNSIYDVSLLRRNILSAKGYIIPTTYAAKESGVYFSNDQSLSERVLSSISFNRIAHKCRRIIRSVLFPYISGNVSIDPSTGTISILEQTRLTNLIIEQLDSHMVNPFGQNQLGGRYVVFDDTAKNLENDELHVNCYFIPVSSNSTIDVQEAYVLNG